MFQCKSSDLTRHEFILHDVNDISKATFYFSKLLKSDVNLKHTGLTVVTLSLN